MPIPVTVLKSVCLPYLNRLDININRALEAKTNATAKANVYAIDVLDYLRVRGFHIEIEMTMYKCAISVRYAPRRKIKSVADDLLSAVQSILRQFLD